MHKAEIINELKAARAELLAALDGLEPGAMLRAGAVGIWSVKDVLAHLTAWQSELVTALNKAQGRGTPNIVKIDDVDEWNAQQYQVNASRPLEVVWSDFEAVHNMLVTMLEDYNERHLTDGRRFNWMEGEPLSYLVQDIATWHEQEHAAEIREWREREGVA